MFVWGNPVSTGGRVSFFYSLNKLLKDKTMSKTIIWYVYLCGEHYDTVEYDESCDHDYVLNALLEKGLHPGIIIYQGYDNE